MAMNWARGLRRVFVLLCVVWAGVVLIWFPIHIANERAETAGQLDVMFRQTQSRSTTPDQIAEHKKRMDVLWEQATLPWIYRHEYLDHWGTVLIVLVVPPALLYGVGWAGFRVSRWLVRGFRAEA
jgi:hypothetical protein